MSSKPSISISFGEFLLKAVQEGRKIVTRRRFGGMPGLMEQPDHYRLQGLDHTGTHFENIFMGQHLPIQDYPFGWPGEMVLQVAESPDLKLEVVAVRVERVQDITKAGALAEGIRLRNTGSDPVASSACWGGLEPDPAGGFRWYDDPVTAFARLLTSFYPLAWKRNAWVWVIEFRRIEL